MAQAKRKQKNTSSQPARPAANSRLIRILREVALIALAAVSLFLFIALFSFDPADPGWSHAAEYDGIRNNTGLIGAWIADILLYICGYVGYLFPFALAFSGWQLYRTVRRGAWPEPLSFSLGMAGFVLALMGACGLAENHFVVSNAIPAETAGAGGILGDAVGGSLLGLIGSTGSALMLLAMFLTGITLYSGLSWFRLMDQIGRYTLRFVEWLQYKRDEYRDRREGARARQERENVAREIKQKTEKREPPRIEPVISNVPTSTRGEKEKQEFLFEPPPETTLPPLNLLDPPQPPKGQYSNEALEAMSRQVEIKLRDFGIEVEVVAVHPGPVITRFELQPAPGVKGSQVINLSKDIARSLSVVSVRVVDVIPGKSVIGLEIPNENRELVSLSAILNSKEYDNVQSPLALALGKDISGQPIVTELNKMPHLLVAGTTGSGKSVAINAMILSILYKAVPKDVRLIMIDPKMLELSVYEGIPHLLAPVVTDMKEAANALRWCVAEMEKRYKLMAHLGVRNISGYNRKIKEARDRGEPIRDPFYQPIGEEDEAPELEELPFIVVLVDELADMMMTVGKKVEELIARLAQKARASGIHLILATQRPSVDVITGLIKANIPCRIGFQVSSKVDSRTILDQMGAETLLGHGDMLFMQTGTPVPTRVHGAFVADHEVHKVVENLRKRGEPEYREDVLRGPEEGGAEAVSGIETGGDGGEQDPLYDEAVRIVTESRRASISSVQRRLRIGYNRAARIVEDMERAGVVSAQETNGNREVLAPKPPEN
ncbi:S-DNA-T family DNA segregation ATPase FtsK/SpoIIIE [Methylohalomonas lacus]|uniref:DNA translocase FtsK n=1 Tax=Methylohalomonas lacus TaxID=398773 RepID=A0AAE3HLS0_9GAMM|nr:DNA translocase FtsK [Methylohalomonas lacus]MCS3902773.1 S-DNA-T family DNA segregation ATPase FtsK/SpoIIIE [Methylohalomonas lacus]